MTTGLAFGAPRRGLRNVCPDRALRPGRPVAREGFRAPPMGAGDPAVDVSGPARFAPMPRQGKGLAQFPVVDAMVTLTVMGAFAAALGLMAGEWVGATSARSLQAVVTSVAPSTSPHIAAIPGPAPCVGPQSI